jgi:hypothetical protein
VELAPPPFLPDPGTTSKVLLPMQRAHSSSPRFLAGPVVAILSGVLLACVSQSARSEVWVEGTSESVRVEARNSSIDEILAALGATVDLRFSTSPELDRVVTGSFQGPLWQVLARLLEGYDYVVTASPSGSLRVLFVSRRTRNAKGSPPSARDAASAMVPPRLPDSIRRLRGLSE